jgi:hypothetical protein
MGHDPGPARRDDFTLRGGRKLAGSVAGPDGKPFGG